MAEPAYVAEHAHLVPEERLFVVEARAHFGWAAK
jgi:hypothetical protein